jgi:alpha-L-rhamnosidase
MNKMKKFYQEEVVASLKKEFSFTSVMQVPRIEKIVVNIAARTLYKLHINGKFVMTGPARSPESYLFVDSINVSEYLRQGENVIAVELLYVGPRGEYDFGAPGFALYLATWRF